jgi:hypothetical protein
VASQKRAAWKGSSPHSELCRRVAALHGGFTAIRGRSELERARLALCGAEAEPMMWKEEGMEVRWPRFAQSRAPASSAMAGGGGKSDRFGFTLAKTEARVGAKARAAQGGAVCRPSRAKVVHQRRIPLAGGGAVCGGEVNPAQDF